MLDTVFYFILNMSVAACFVIAALLIVRLIRPLPRRVVYPLWALAFFRLVMPFTLLTSWSLFNFTGGLVKRLVTIESITRPWGAIPGNNILGGTFNDTFSWASMNTIGAAEQYAPIVYKTETLRMVFTSGAVVWAVIAAAALITVIILYLLTSRQLKKAVHVRDNIYRSDMVISPVLVGLPHARIILPANLDPDGAEGRVILAHENTHKSRLDNLWRLLGIFVTCLHWFNPLAWIMLKSFLTDMELSCDEVVIRKFNTSERKQYAETLLRFSEGNRPLASAAFGRSGVRARIVNVLNYKRLTLAGAIASAVFLAAIAVALITNPQLRG